MIEGVGAGEIGITLLAALHVTSELARDGEELALKVTAMKWGHDARFPCSPESCPIRRT